MDSENSVVMILANHDFRDEEYQDAFDTLRAAGFEVKIAATVNEDCVGVGGTEVSVDLTIDEIDTNEFDGVVFIGGTGIEGYLHDELVHGVAKSFVKANKVVAAICWAPEILANAGLLQGKKVTAWSGAKENLEKAGAIYSANALEIDGMLITADGPDSAGMFGAAIARAIAG